MKKVALVASFLIIFYGFRNPACFNNSSVTTPRIERGSLLLNVAPAILDSFIINKKINFTYVCSVCSFLTDNDSIYYKGHLVPRKKKAFTRHIKHLYEQLAEAFIDNKDVDSDIMEIFYELALFRESLQQKTLAAAEPEISFREKVNMIRDSWKSSRVFQYKIGTTDHEAGNVDPSDLSADPPDSPFWHKQTSSVNPEERFYQLARLKKINPSDNIVVLFDKSGLDGSSPKIDVLDMDPENGWSLKWGDEVHTDAVGSRIFAALGYDVDHPYYYGKDKLTLVFDESKEIKNASELKSVILRTYKIDLTPFISSSGTISNDMAALQTDLKSFIGKQFVRFKECAIEARPDRVKRIGSFAPFSVLNEDRRELRGALLANAFIGNWDTREDNTLFTCVRTAHYEYRMSAVFSDLGTSLGVSYGTCPPDFKVGLVNELPWEVASAKNGIITLNNPINAILPFYRKATYQDLLWMAKKIALIDGPMLTSMIAEGHWPPPVSELFFHKLASRRASILRAFNVDDPNPIPFDKKLRIVVDGVEVIKNGKLMIDLERENNPESLLFTKGRFRNYGN